MRGNLQYLLNELNANPAFSDFEIYVRTREDTDAIVQAYIDQNHWSRTRTVLKDGSYDRLLESAKYLITEVYFPESWIKKEGQLYLNLWHGTPLKKIGLEKHSNNIHREGHTQRDFIVADYLLYPNEFTEQAMFSSYKVSDLMQGEIVKLGYPRTGGMLACAATDQTELKNQLAPNGETLYAYMPTWKDYQTEAQAVSDVIDLLDYLEQHLSDDQLLYVNLHHKVSAVIDYSAYQRIKPFPPTVDSYQLLSLTTALITDYSSVFFDYLSLRRQIILYCGDYEIYRDQRGINLEFSELPFDQAKTPEEVLQALNRGKTYDDTAAYERFCHYDALDNAKKWCGLLLGETDQVQIEAIPKSGKKQVLLYDHTLAKSRDTWRLQEYAKVEKNYQVYYGCEKNQVEHHKESAYPMLFHVPVFGVRMDYLLSQEGETALALYQGQQISFAEAMEVLAFDYQTVGKRMFGEADFDLLAIYDLDDPKMLLILTFLKAKKKVFFFSDAAYKKLAAGDIYYQDALCYALPKMDVVCVNTTKKAKLLKSLCQRPVLVQKRRDGKSLHQQINLFLQEP